ncbi:MAG: response regulator transcription factor [Litorilinea sp.]
MNLLDAIQVLVVDDEKMIRNLLKMSLQRMGYEVTTAADGAEGIQRFAEGEFDLVLLDILMPGIDGFDVCLELRKMSDVPIVMLTALNRPDDVVRGLEMGADNYITKPFTFKEVEARIRAILRRTALRIDSQKSFQILEVGDVKLDSGMRAATVAGQLVELTPTEYELLHYMMVNPDRPVAKNDLLRDVWGYEASDTNSNIVELAVRRLRKKIEEDASNPRRLLTVRGVGYKFVSLKTSKSRDGDRPRHRRLPAVEVTEDRTNTERENHSVPDDKISEVLGQILDDVEIDDREH